ncbi:MAG: phosphate signaling complex protein PhoU [Chloroflexi bacterium]|nr:phosphate signaling complex protein PhoU [Chloroflexota bacterium]MCL5275983.1 phosphate signaling complex protein PhoU [Chloroflexota bacterium]
MRTQFNQELNQISADIRTLSEQANQAASRAVAALIKRDFAEAREVKRDDHSTDQLRYEIENTCVVLMATQQPVATDLRKLVAATFVAVELERCADYAKGVAKAARRLSRANSSAGSYNLAEMETFARGMLDRAVNAFINVDVAAAKTVISDDDHIDGMYDDLVNKVTSDMTEDFTQVESGTWLLHAGHCLERYADRATNIAERVIFIQSGNLTGDLNVHPPEAARKIEPPNA